MRWNLESAGRAVPACPGPTRHLGQAPAPLSLFPHLWKESADQTLGMAVSVLSREREPSVAELSCSGRRRSFWGPGPGTSCPTGLLVAGELGREGLTASPWFFGAAQ